MKAEDAGLINVCTGMNSTCGYINKSGKVIIPFEYEYTSDFSEDLAMVCKNGKCGHINRSGQIVIPMIYDAAFDFSQGLAHVRKNDKSGYINTKGEPVIPFEYYAGKSSTDGLIPVCKNKEKCGYIDHSNHVIVPFKYTETNEYSEGLGKVRIKDKYGAIDTKGNMVIPSKYIFLGELKNNQIEACIESEKNDYKCGILNSKNEKVVAFNYRYIEKMSEGFYLYNVSDNEFGFLDKNLVNIFNETFYLANRFSDGLASVCQNPESGDKCGYINKSGRIVLKYKYSSAVLFKNDIAPAMRNGKWGFINKKGKVVIPFKYDYAGQIF